MCQRMVGEVVGDVAYSDLMCLRRLVKESLECNALRLDLLLGLQMLILGPLLRNQEFVFQVEI